MSVRENREDVERIFPKLRGTKWEVKSPRDSRYNCVAWVVDDKKNWWEPDPMGQYYWPPGLRRGDYSIDAYKEMFESLGYESSSAEEGEEGYVKIAIFGKYAHFEHVTRQRESSIWTSKLGRDEDIDHPLEAIAGNVYGTPAIFLRKQ